MTDGHMEQDGLQCAKRPPREMETHADSRRWIAREEWLHKYSGSCSSSSSSSGGGVRSVGKKPAGMANYVVVADKRCTEEQHEGRTRRAAVSRPVGRRDASGTATRRCRRCITMLARPSVRPSRNYDAFHRKREQLRPAAPDWRTRRRRQTGKLAQRYSAAAARQAAISAAIVTKRRRRTRGIKFQVHDSSRQYTAVAVHFRLDDGLRG